MTLSDETLSWIADQERIVETENADKFALIEKKARGNLFDKTINGIGNVVSGVGRGAGNAVADVLDTTTDMAFLAGIGIADKAVSLVGRDVPEEQVFEDLQKFRDGMTSYIRSEESDNGLQTFAMNVTESLGKFAFFYSGLTKAGAGKMAAVAGAGAAEGFTNDPDRDLLIMDKALRATVEGIAPDMIGDYDRAMSPETDSRIARQLMRRVMSAVEISALSVTAEKAAGVAGQAAKAGVKHIPEPVMEKMVQGFGQVMEKTRRAKEWLGSGKKQSFDNFVPTGKTEVSFNPAGMDAFATPKENIRNAVRIDYDPERLIRSADDWDGALKEYEDKLTELAPQIYDSVVSMAKSKGVSEDNLLADYARGLGMREADKLTVEGLKDVLRAQAHNALFEQQTLSFSMAAHNFKKGAMSEDAYLASAKSFYTSFLQRSALLTGAGRTMRTAQEIPPALQKLNKDLQKFGTSFDDALGAYQKTLDDPGALKALADGMEETLAIHNLLGGDSDKITAAMLKAVAAVDRKKTGMELAKEIGDAVGATYQANLLSGIWTLSQNTFGSAAQLSLRNSEAVIEAGVSRLMGRQSGDATLREAMIRFKYSYEGHLDALMLSGKAAQKLLMFDKKGAGDVFRQQMTNLPEMNQRVKSDLFRLNKEDMKAKSGSVNDYISENVFLSTVTGRPVLDFIAVQDMVTKSAAARAFMRGRFDTAMYVDDVFGIAGKVDDLPQAREILNEMFLSGRKHFSPDELKAMGLPTDDAIKVSQKLDTWIKQTSDDAAEYALDAAMQTPLTGPLKAAQEILQDTMPGGRVFVPFFTTPTNIINESFKRMPILQAGEAGAIGLPIHPKFYSDFMAGGIRQKQAIARAVSGMTLAQTGMLLADQGLFQYVPRDPNESRTVANLFNTMPGSLVIGGTSYPVAMLGPVGILLAYGSSLHAHEDALAGKRHMDDDYQAKFSDAVLFNVASFMQIVREAPYAKSLDDLAGLFDIDPTDEKAQEKLAEWAAKTAGNLVPYSALQRQFHNNMMEEQTRANGLWESFVGQFAPFANAKAYNAMSETIVPQNGILLRQKQIEEDPEIASLMRNALFVPKEARFKMMIPSERDKPMVQVTLTNDQWDDFHTIVRDELDLRRKLSSLVNNPVFRKNAEMGRMDMNKADAEAIVNGTRTYALKLLISRDRDLQYNIEQERNKALIDRNIPPPVPAGQRNVPTFLGNR